MKVLIVGSRRWPDVQAVHDRVDALPKASTVIVGGAWGADAMAETAARARGLEVVVERAVWERDGRRAGILRNLRMLDMAPTLVIAFWAGRSPGTRHTIVEALKRQIPVEIHWRPDGGTGPHTPGPAIA